MLSLLSEIIWIKRDDEMDAIFRGPSAVWLKGIVLNASEFKLVDKLVLTGGLISRRCEFDDFSGNRFEIMR